MAQRESGCLIIYGFASSITKTCLIDRFQKFGDLVNIFIFNNTEAKYAKITFCSSKDATKCYQYYHGYNQIPILGDESIKMIEGDGSYNIVKLFQLSKISKKSTKSKKSKRFVLNAQKIKIYINECTVEEMKQVKGIGPELSKRIDEARRKKQFTSINDIINNVKGLGNQKMKNIQKTTQISFASVTFGFCRESADKLKIGIIPDVIINLIRVQLIEFNELQILVQKKQNNDKCEEITKNDTTKSSKCRSYYSNPRTITNGVNSGFTYYPKQYRSNKPWRRLRR